MGDFRDLRQFARWSRQQLNADFLLLNPLGAPLPVIPMEASPYFPSSRLFLDPLYLCVEEVSGAKAAGLYSNKLGRSVRSLNSAPLIDRDKVFNLKQAALEKIFRKFKGHRRFDQYRDEQGKTLFLFSVFCVLIEEIGNNWRKWPANLRHPASPAIADFAAKHEWRVKFHQWLQWQLDEQFKRASRELPVIMDVPIGINARGFDAWLWQDMLAFDVSIGAPPDAFNRAGQNWGLPPFIPDRLRASGYVAFKQTIRAMLRHAHGLRIDHVMGLFRLFWIPRDGSPKAGAYVRYDADELLAILAIESQRANAIIVGEDLGTVERGVRPHLHRWGVLSYRLFWFEKTSAARYPQQALAAISTHDLYTIAGLWSGKDLEEQKRYGLSPAHEETLALRQKLLRTADLKDPARCQDAIEGAYRELARAPSQLITTTLEDALAVEQRPNIPGLASQRPNWCIALPKTLEEIRRNKFIPRLAKILRRK
jgi:4-alpha-glucanotransferase